jgi:hypothetical protein
MPEKSGLPRVHIQNTTLPGVEYEIQEALNSISIEKNQDQRRKGRSFAQCPKSRMKPHAAVRLLRNLSNLGAMLDGFLAYASSRDPRVDVYE